MRVIYMLIFNITNNCEKYSLLQHTQLCNYINEEHCYHEIYFLRIVETDNRALMHPKAEND